MRTIFVVNWAPPSLVRVSLGSAPGGSGRGDHKSPFLFPPLLMRGYTHLFPARAAIYWFMLRFPPSQLLDQGGLLWVIANACRRVLWGLR